MALDFRLCSGSIAANVHLCGGQYLIFAYYLLQLYYIVISYLLQH